MREPEPIGEPGCDRHRPVDSRCDDAVDGARRGRADRDPPRPRPRRSHAGRRTRSPARGIAVAGDHEEAALTGGPQEPELRRPGAENEEPRPGHHGESSLAAERPARPAATRLERRGSAASRFTLLNRALPGAAAARGELRRALRRVRLRAVRERGFPPGPMLGVPGDRPLETLLERRARAPAEQPLGLLGRADVPVHLSGTVLEIGLEGGAACRGRRAPGRRSRRRVMSTPVATLTTSPATSSMSASITASIASASSST